MPTSYLIRHAKAGDREDWQGDDRLRPLTKSGRKQAEALVEILEDHPIDRILSSGYLRCVQTVEPLATARKLPVETVKQLEEGAGGESVVRLVERFKGKNVALCTHGDVVEEFLEIVIEHGLLSRARASNEKGGTWVLQDRNGTITGATYLAAP
jgi:phosphohistidine phosphatase SixA